MSNQTSSVVLSICGIAAVVGVLIVLAAFLLLRVLKMSIFGLAVNALRILAEPKEEPSALDRRAQSVERPSSRDLREQAQSLDFDAAVARQRGITSSPFPGQSVDPNATFSAQSTAPNPPLDAPTPRLRKRHPLRGTDELEDEGLLGGMLDDDDIL